ncbi:MAG: DHHA1 domain-containing protein [Endomicrobia bacterium]|nr:DHHA1 domain-containing protein [Endomicrobiia bacterium]
MNKTYKDFINKQLETNTGLQQIYNLLPKLKGKKIVTFCHDDPDGVTSGIIFKRLTDKLEINNHLFFPYTFQLSREEVENIKDIYTPKALFIIDKGTIETYNSFIDLIEHVVVIDHHPKIGNQFDKIIVYNPAIPKYVRTSGSFLVHILASLFDATTSYDDFICLVGMKCDWAVDPLYDDIPEFSQIFFNERVREQYNWLLQKRINLRPTMFDIKNPNQTCLLNQISELFFGVTGGGFQYFYNSYDERLKYIDQPKLCFETFIQEFPLPKINTVDEFIDLLNNKEVVHIIYKYFLNDWDKTENLFDTNTMLVKYYKGIKIFFFFGKDVKLMPMVGSKKLYQLSDNSEAVIIMFNSEPNNSIHVSLRGNTNKIHLGHLASSLAEQLNSQLNDKTKISGGGHPFAAECKIKDAAADLMSVLKYTIHFLEQQLNTE